MLVGAPIPVHDVGWSFCRKGNVYAIESNHLLRMRESVWSFPMEKRNRGAKKVSLEVFFSFSLRRAYLSVKAVVAPNDQHEPHCPWSCILRMDSQNGHASRESKADGTPREDGDVINGMVPQHSVQQTHVSRCGCTGPRAYPTPPNPPRSRCSRRSRV